MRRDTRKLLNLGLELPPAERAKLARELLRSASLDREPAGEVAEPVSSYGQELFEPFVQSPEAANDSSWPMKVDAAIAGVWAALPELEAPQVLDLEIEMGHDPNGRAMAAVVVILRDHPKGRLYGWDQLAPIDDLIWKAFNSQTGAAEGPWPYVTFRQKSEKDVLDSEDVAV